ncbi:MAG: PDZ domain-containing protein [Ignavibacteriaceae bacterium]
MVASISESSPNKDKFLTTDIIESLDGEELNFKNIRDKLQVYQHKEVGDTVKTVVIRNNNKINLNLILEPVEMKYLFEIDPAPSNAQMKLREAWMENM